MNEESRTPPKNTRFKKGRSGNPKGRPRQTAGQVSPGSRFRKVAREQISIEIEGIRYKMPRWDAYVRQVYNMALNKNSSAARLLDQLRKQFPGDLLPGDPITFYITEEDARL
jgi:Family of unknown function (DUF5681)